MAKGDDVNNAFLKAYGFGERPMSNTAHAATEEVPSDEEHMERKLRLAVQQQEQRARIAAWLAHEVLYDFNNLGIDYEELCRITAEKLHAAPPKVALAVHEAAVQWEIARERPTTAQFPKIKKAPQPGVFARMRDKLIDWGFL